MFLDNGNILNLHSWEAPIVRSTREINEAIKARGIANKKLRAVRPLGLAWQLHQHNKYHVLKRALTRQRHHFSRVSARRGPANRADTGAV